MVFIVEFINNPELEDMNDNWEFFFPDFYLPIIFE